MICAVEIGNINETKKHSLNISYEVDFSLLLLNIVAGMHQEADQIIPVSNESEKNIEQNSKCIKNSENKKQINTQNDLLQKQFRSYVSENILNVNQIIPVSNESEKNIEQNRRCTKDSNPIMQIKQDNTYVKQQINKSLSCADDQGIKKIINAYMDRKDPTKQGSESKHINITSTAVHRKYKSQHLKIEQNILKVKEIKPKENIKILQSQNKTLFTEDNIKKIINKLDGHNNEIKKYTLINNAEKIKPEHKKALIIAVKENPGPKPLHLNTDNNPVFKISDIDKFNIINQLAEKIEQFYITKGNKEEIVVNLKPEFLGRIKIKLISENGHIKINLTTENHIAKDIINSNLPLLQRMLVEQGLPVHEINLFINWQGYHEHRREPEYKSKTSYMNSKDISSIIKPASSHKKVEEIEDAGYLDYWV